MKIRLFKAGTPINEQVRRVRSKQELYLPFVEPLNADANEKTVSLILRHTMLSDEITLLKRSRAEWIKIANIKSKEQANDKAQEIKSHIPILYCYEHPHAGALPRQHPLSHAEADLQTLLTIQQFSISGHQAANLFLESYAMNMMELVDAIIETEEQLDALVADHGSSKVSA